MKKIILFSALLVNLYANNLVDLYREEGLLAVENKLEESLQTEEYWNKYLEDKNIDYGYYETKEYLILTQKENSELFLLKKENNNFKVISKSNIISGKNEGDKYFEGDKKTPEGVYELVSKKTKLDPFYGPLALVTSYPNTYDKTLDKKGHGIWIHGMPIDKEREKFTKGCIALDNTNLKALDSQIDLKNAVLFTSQGQFQKTNKQEIVKVLTTIYKWKDSWKKSDTTRYLQFYSKLFKKSDGSNFKRFASIKKRIFAKGEEKRIKFTNIDIFPYPNSLNKKMFKVMMDEDYISPSLRFQGKKELFLEIINNKVEILAEG